MYWQAYLHKTSLVAELMLTRILKRAKELTVGVTLPCSEPLQYFLQHKVTMDTFDDVTLDLFAQLDDFDIISVLKGNARVILFYPR
jgi:HD superfamily phosphohydrolase